IAVLTRRDIPSIAAARPAAPEWGSDVVAEMLRRLDIPYIALEPGASFRGLHDSIVNYLGNERPAMILANHEEVAVAIAHGYAKVTGRAMAAAVHSSVGLMHATMTIFCAWVDRMPVVVLGRTGAWPDLVELAESLGAAVASDGAAAVSFPTDHPLHQGASRTQSHDAFAEAVRDADVILALERVDVAGALREREGKPVRL